VHCERQAFRRHCIYSFAPNKYQDSALARYRITQSHLIKMRFGRTLERAIYQPWRDSYIDYAKLKKLLREDDSASNSPDRQTSDRWTEDDEGAFVDELVNVQLEQVHAFHKDTYEKLSDQTAKCEARLDSIAVAGKGQAEGKDGEQDKDAEGSNGKKPVPSEEEKKTTLQEVLKELDHITKETNELETYARINYAGFLKAAKKHDRKRGHAYRRCDWPPRPSTRKTTTHSCTV
jgi:SPX domain protein involved in polyphosphate accumulation